MDNTIRISATPPVMYMGQRPIEDTAFPADLVTVTLKGNGDRILNKITQAQSERENPYVEFPFADGAFRLPVLRGVISGPPDSEGYEAVKLLALADKDFMVVLEREIQRQKARELRDNLNAFLDEDDRDVV